MTPIVWFNVISAPAVLLFVVWLASANNSKWLWVLALVQTANVAWIFTSAIKNGVFQ